jgi:cation transporter-like permease
LGYVGVTLYISLIIINFIVALFLEIYYGGKLTLIALVIIAIVSCLHFVGSVFIIFAFLKYYHDNIEPLNEIVLFDLSNFFNDEKEDK